MTKCVTSYFGAGIYNSFGAASVSDSIIDGFRFPEALACYDTDNGATDYYLATCFDYQLSNGQYDARCGMYDDLDFTASLMCCSCGAGSETFTGHRGIIYHVARLADFLLDSSSFLDNDLPAVYSLHENSVAIRNCEGLNASHDVQGSALLTCDIQDGYCPADYCIDTTTGFEARNCDTSAILLRLLNNS